MTLIIRLLTAGAILSAYVHALTVSHGDAIARHHQHITRVERDVENVPERSVGAELQQRGGGKIGLGWSGNAESNIPEFVSSKTK
jgi:hypothetical protein